MDDIGKLARRAEKQLTNGSAEPTRSAQATPAKVISRLWQRMQQMYGHSWHSAYGATDDGTWAVGLADFTAEEIGLGLRRCLDRNSSFPPSLPEFRALCRPKQKRENAAMYHIPPPDRMLPHKLTDEEREAGRGHLAALRDRVRQR